MRDSLISEVLLYVQSSLGTDCDGLKNENGLNSEVVLRRVSIILLICFHTLNRKT